MNKGTGTQTHKNKVGKENQLSLEKFFYIAIECFLIF